MQCWRTRSATRWPCWLKRCSNSPTIRQTRKEPLYSHKGIDQHDKELIAAGHGAFTGMSDNELEGVGSLFDVNSRKKMSLETYKDMLAARGLRKEEDALNEKYYDNVVLSHCQIQFQIINII